MSILVPPRVLLNTGPTSMGMSRPSTIAPLSRKGNIASFRMNSAASESLGYLGCQDFTLALQLGRLAVELSYLAYFASEGMPYLGSKWLAQIGHARRAVERLSRAPPSLGRYTFAISYVHSGTSWSASTFASRRGILTAMRHLIEEKTLFRIAFHACPQVHSL